MNEPQSLALWGSLLVQLSTHNSLFHYPSGAGMDLINDSQQSGNILIHWQRFSSNLVYFSPHQERALMSTNHRATVHIRYSWKGWRTRWLLVHFQISDFSITLLVKELCVWIFFTLIQFYFTCKELNLNSSHIKVLSTVTERNPNNQMTPYERAIWRQWRGCGWEARDKTKGLLWKLARTHNSIQSLAITMLSQLIIV